MGHANLHKLHSSWSLWYLPEVRATPGSPSVNVNDSLRKADSFQTVEEFWSIYNVLPHADKLTVGEQFMFFRDPTQPMWEDPSLTEGGMISIWTDHTDAADNFIQTFLSKLLGESLTVEKFDNKQNVV